MDAAFEWLVFAIVALVCGGPLWVILKEVSGDA